MIELALNLLVAVSMFAGALLFAAGWALGFRARQQEDARAARAHARRLRELERRLAPRVRD